MSRYPNTAPIRLVLLDAFDTLVTPRTAPHLQYAAVARDFGLAVADDGVKIGFKHAFRTTAQEHPNYGLETGIPSPDEWWKLVVQRTFAPRLHPGVSSQQYDRTIESLSQRLVTRFGTCEAYRLFPDVVPTLEKLTHAHGSDGRPLRLALATNSDSRILSVLKSFGLDRFLELYPAVGARGPNCSHRVQPGPTLSYFEKCAKPDPRFFHAAIQRASQSDAVKADNVLYVGDQLYEDFWAATGAGLQAAWLQRPSSLESNQPFQQVDKQRSSQQDQAYVQARTIPSLSSLLHIVTQSH